jgi:hypothetical protein
MDSEIVRKLLWAGLVAASGALASLLANRVAAALYVRITGEDPPE